MENGTSPIALKFPEQTGRDGPRMKLGRAWQRQSNSSSGTGERTHSAEFHPMPFERPLQSNEKEHAAPASAQARLLPQTRRKCPLIVDEPKHGRYRSNPSPHRDFQPTCQKNLPQLISTRDWRGVTPV